MPSSISTDTTATLEVLATIEAGDDLECKDVDGATASWEQFIGTSGSGTEICMGPKGADPARAINGAKTGDCLAIVGDAAERTSCDASDANYEVLSRLDDVSTLSEATACDNVPGTTVYYTWSWVETRTTGVSLPNLNIDVVLCLAEV